MRDEIMQRMNINTVMCPNRLVHKKISKMISIKTYMHTHKHTHIHRKINTHTYFIFKNIKFKVIHC